MIIEQKTVFLENIQKSEKMVDFQTFFPRGIFDLGAYLDPNISLSELLTPPKKNKLI